MNDVYAPIAGVIAAVNGALVDAPELVNSDPFGDGWFATITPADGAALEGLMDAAAYRVFSED